MNLKDYIGKPGEVIDFLFSQPGQPDTKDSLARFIFRGFYHMSQEGELTESELISSFLKSGYTEAWISDNLLECKMAPVCPEEMENESLIGDFIIDIYRNEDDRNSKKNRLIAVRHDGVTFTDVRKILYQNRDIASVSMARDWKGDLETGKNTGYSIGYGKYSYPKKRS